MTIVPPDTKMSEFINFLLEGNTAEAVCATQQLRADGIPIETIIIQGIEKAMEQLDAKCTMEQFNLLEIMLAGRAMMAVMKELYPDDAPREDSGYRVVLAALEGDVHDLGKGIVRMVLTAKGYDVIDCGKDCPVSRLVDAVEEHRPLAVGISGLISSIVPQVQLVRDLLNARSAALNEVALIASGAALKQLSAERLNVDFVADSVFDGLHYLNQLRARDGA